MPPVALRWIASCVGVPLEGFTLKFLYELLHGQRGQDLAEYGLLAAFISITAIVTVRAIGPLVVPLYERVHAVF